MMGELARSVRASGGHTIGVIPQALKDLEVADLEADELVVTHDMRQRKGVWTSVPMRSWRCPEVSAPSRN